VKVDEGVLSKFTRQPTEKMLDEVAEMARDSARGGFSLFLGDASSTAILAVGLGGMDRSAMLKVFMSMAKALSALTLIVLGFGVAGAILGHVLGYVVAGAAGLFLIARSLRTLKPKSGGGGGFVENLKLMIGYGYPLYLSRAHRGSMRTRYLRVLQRVH
jgi:hypothetical protein